jgi:hypothetical protein
MYNHSRHLAMSQDMVYSSVEGVWSSVVTPYPGGVQVVPVRLSEALCQPGVVAVEVRLAGKGTDLLAFWNAGAAV